MQRHRLRYRRRFRCPMVLFVHGFGGGDAIGGIPKRVGTLIGTEPVDIVCRHLGFQPSRSTAAKIARAANGVYATARSIARVSPLLRQRYGGIAGQGRAASITSVHTSHRESGVGSAAAIFGADFDIFVYPIVRRDAWLCTGVSTR